MFRTSFLLTLLVSLFSCIEATDPSVDLIIFSYNRPLQLHALLESIEQFVTGIDHTYVVYRADTEYQEAYQLVRARFDSVRYHQQGNQPTKDFKPITMKLVRESSDSAYIIFAVDDIVVKDTVDVAYCAQLLEKTGAYGFYLRLGKNLTHCYMRRCQQPLPPFVTVAPGVYSWVFNKGAYDWNYPNTVDMTLYRKSDVVTILDALQYSSPNTLEGRWNQTAHQVQRRTGLCFERSVIVNLPLNLVQHDFTHNRHMNEISTKELLELYIKGFRMDIAPLFKVANTAAHMEYVPKFITINQ